MTRKRILEVLEATPEVRDEKIAVLKKAVTAGTYQVRADDIARKILKEFFFELVRTPKGHEYREWRKS